ncbi:hypothetical protein SAMN05443667_103171 [Flavobacterium gillisiae]|uniref:SIMPL domain-containing protein n=1 Tax=Flavobacterium gillisiae TaxID=150146 RepID=A0A1H4A3D1_9FLAO|nr:SIMPL domain-containing protein [Flavobacterium gillisiae]SEA30141.1 hypothetical protein SAMN05443667_103171 [Flavobacterium gillisiae]
MNRTLIITGKGKVSATPDIVYIRFPILVNDVHYATAVKGLDGIVASLRNCITTNGINKNELKTSDFRVNTQTKWNDNTKEYEFSKFEAHHDLLLQLPFDTELINNTTNDIVKLERNIEFQISFGVKDSTIYKQLLIENAISDAKKSAAIIAHASDIKLKEILNINYSFSEITFRSDLNYSYDSCLMETNEKIMPDLNPDAIDVNESITITWRIEN